MSTINEEHGVYSSSHKLEDQEAASAAMYVTRDTPSSKSGSHPLLDEDGKLSSAGAATSLKYARAQDLPSFPSTGGVKMSSAGAAASIAESNQKTFEHWKPGSIPAANKAAMMAKDYEMDPLWQPGGSKSSNSAAGQAMNMKMPDAITSRTGGADAHRKALMAATGAMSAGRRRAGSAPMAPQGDGGWALKAATSSQKSNLSGAFATGDPGFEASRLQNMRKGNVNRAMYGSAPPVAIEVEEKRRNDMLRASAVAMAQKMYAVQQNIIEEAKKSKEGAGHTGARSAHHRALSDASSTLSNEEAAAPQYQNLEEQARKLAQARLAKIHDEHAEYRSYYGQNNPPKSRMTLRGRRRASSDGQFLDDDAEATRRITTQMSIFTSKLAEVDSKKRQNDRDNLMAAAHRNVTARMNTMDEKVFQETGKQSPHQRELWEAEARKRAQTESDDRMVNHGKVHIGGGKYLDQSDIDAIARARLQPTLDDISDKAEKQRARDEEIRLEQERIKREAEIEKSRQAEIKAEQKKIADQEKADEKARKTEEKRIQKEADLAAKEKAKAEAAVQKEAADAEKERLRQEAAVRKEADNAEKERLRQEAAIRKQAESAEKEKARSEAATEKERLRAQKETEKEEKRKSKDTKGTNSGGALAGGALGATAAGGAAATKDELAFRPGTATEAPNAVEPEGDTVHDQVTMTQTNEDDPFVDSKEDTVDNGDVTLFPTEQGTARSAPTTTNREMGETPASPPKSDSKVKSWFKTRFRSGSSTQKTEEASGFVGGAALTGTGVPEESEEPKSDSERNVALAGRSTTNKSDDMYGGAEPTTIAPAAPAAPEARSRSPSISSLSSSDYGEPSREVGPEGSVASDPPRGRRGFKERFLNKIHAKEPAPAVATNSPVAATKVSSGTQEPDEFEEARDTFEEEKLAPPPKLTDVVADDGPGPVMKAVSPTPGSRERSKFTEEL